MKNKTKISASLAGTAIAAVISAYGYTDHVYESRDLEKVPVMDNRETSAFDLRRERLNKNSERTTTKSHAARHDHSNEQIRQVIAHRKQSFEGSPEFTKAAYQVSGQNAVAYLPDEALPGECYGKVIVPAEYEVVTERVLQEEGHTRLETTPAQYEWVEEEVLVKPASTRLEVVEATYKTVEERVMVEPERKEAKHIPAQFKTVTERVMVEPAKTKWMNGDVEVKNPDNVVGDLVCLVETEAKYKTVEKRVMTEPARTEYTTIPAKYEMVEKTVVDVPAHTKEIEIPAEYKTVRVQKLVSPEKINEIDVEPVYVNVERYKEIEPAYVSWEPVLCKDEIDPVIAIEIESRLNENGFNPGLVDGEIDANTEAAVHQFQMENGLARGAISPETLEKLGIINLEEEASSYAEVTSIRM